MQAESDGERPWGRFSTVVAGQRHAVKTITVHPGHRTSLQSHRYRREIWTVVSGVMLATINGKNFSALEGQTLHVGYGEIHRIACAGVQPLTLIEVQYGSLCAEDDITRYEDDYGRVLQERCRAAPMEGIRTQIASSFVPDL